MSGPSAELPRQRPRTLVSPALTTPTVASPVRQLSRARGRLRRPGADAVERWSRFVRTMRWVLPAIAVGMIATLIAWPFVFGNGSGLRVTGGEVVMLKPRYSGTTADNSGYTVEAEQARNLTGTGDSVKVELTRPFAGITLVSGDYLGLRAGRGLLDQSARDLELSGGVELFSGEGYRLVTERAQLSGRDRAAHGETPVEGWGPQAKLNASGFRITDQGNTLIFTGPARLVLTIPEAAPDPNSAAAQASDR